MRRVMFTGGAGFIGSNLIRYWMLKYPDDEIINVDSLTYAANLSFVDEFVREKNRSRNYFFELCDIRDLGAVEYAIIHHKPDIIIHLAAESHVCNSLEKPRASFETNALGTFNLLDAARRYWGNSKTPRFHYVSTDEVFGELGPLDPPFDESNAVVPRSPYAASKAAGDLMCFAFRDSFSFPVTVSNCSNNFGDNQHSEKLIPRTVHRLFTGEPVTIYGNGQQVRDWIWVLDHCRAIDLIVHKGTLGHRYCVGGDRELTNLQMIAALQDSFRRVTGRTSMAPLTFVDSRPTDDQRYAIDNKKINQLGFTPDPNFEDNLDSTVFSLLEKLGWRADGPTGDDPKRESP